jgi:7,8-dihydropterin-6-yl-methyl-4-(beta-D-ribofuranosyl)aminobenzene 5'-phosphate synthase
MSSKLLELDSVEFLVIIDNEVDPISKYPNPQVSAYGNLADVAANTQFHPSGRGEQCHEIKMSQLCCGAHGLSLMIVSGSRLSEVDRIVEIEDADNFPGAVDWC